MTIKTKFKFTSVVPDHMSLIWSQIALAADMALDSFRALMTAAPLCCTVCTWSIPWKYSGVQCMSGSAVIARLNTVECIPVHFIWLTVMNSPLSQASSLTASKQASSLPDILTMQWCTSGYWVDEWLPQMITFLTWLAGTPQRIATCNSGIQRTENKFRHNNKLKGKK